jgi:hypothetical protein
MGYYQQMICSGFGNKLMLFFKLTQWRIDSLNFICAECLKMPFLSPTLKNLVTRRICLSATKELEEMIDAT